MKQSEAVQVLGDVSRIQKQTRSHMNSMWFPLILFGALTVLSAAVVEISGGPGFSLGIYWMVAGILGGIAVGRHFRKRELTLGLQGPAVPYALTGLGILVGTSAAGWLGGLWGYPTLAAAGPPLVVAAGYLVFAALARSMALGGVALALGALVASLWLAGLDMREYYSHLTVAYGLVLLISGLAFRYAEADRT